MQTSTIASMIISLGLVLPASPWAATPAAPAAQTSGQPQASSWKTVPEDPTPWRREPFSTLRGKQSAALQPPASVQPIIQLQGIMKGSTRYYALVNGRAVRSGDQIDGWTVANINRTSLTIRRDKDIHIYDIYKGKIDRGNR